MARELIANNPYPLVDATSPAAQASEVATMDYARNVLRLPFSKVLDWSAWAEGTDVEWGVHFD